MGTGETKNGGPAIRVEALRKAFGEQTVLGGIDLEVARGETVTVLGRSGTGKSVLLKLIIGLQKPDAGTIQVNGAEITHLSLDQLNEIRKKIGFLFQHAALYDSLSVAENVAFPLRRHMELPDAELKERVQELLARVEMEQDAQKMPAQISGGMQKRVGLARALALNPEIMLLDEPTAGLDPITAAEINHLIQELQRGGQLSSIVVTHDMRCVKAVANRVALLDEGNIKIEGTLEELKKSDDPFVAEFLQEEEEL
jgi:phospholipid/cholesterol/gamma-HCH transport system ATP-binding protein